MTMPPSLVDRPLMPCPPLRTASGTSWVLANASAEHDLARPKPTCSTSPGDPPRMYVERTREYPASPGSMAASASAVGMAS